MNSASNFTFLVKFYSKVLNVYIFHTYQIELNINADN